MVLNAKAEIRLELEHRDLKFRQQVNWVTKSALIWARKLDREAPASNHLCPVEHAH